jgi:hypothetical protein
MTWIGSLELNKRRSNCHQVVFLFTYEYSRFMCSEIWSDICRTWNKFLLNYQQAHWKIQLPSVSGIT